MSKVVGDASMINWAKGLPVGNNQCFINWEGLAELPPQFEVVVTSIRFDPATLKIKTNGNFTEVNKKYMPTTSMYYKIAEACGISGDTSKVQPLYENVDINPMLMKDMCDEPTYRLMKTGVTITKQGKRLTEDGRFLLSSPCSNTYNAWDRCTNDWAKEEKYTEGYTLPPKYSNKYKGKYDRKCHFLDELKFADQKSESKAQCKTIRELAGLPTAFEFSDLQSGVLMFSKVRKSNESLQMEQLAYLASIEKKGNNREITKALFGSIEEPEKQAEVIVERTLLEVLKDYAAILPVDGNLNKMIDWLTTVGDNATVGDNNTFYLKAVNKLKDIESKIEEDQKIPHGEF